MIIKIKNLRANTILGIYEWEKKCVRPVVYNIEIEFDPAQVLKTQRVEDTVDYDTLSKQIVSFTESRSFELVESLAQQVLDKIMAHPLVIKARVEVDKPGAVFAADSVSVTCSAQKQGFNNPPV